MAAQKPAFWLFLAAAAPCAAGSAKRGLALNSETICEDLKLFEGLNPWFYGWGRSPQGSQYPSCQGSYDSGFVPMYWGKTSLNQTDVFTGGDAILGFNEPNHKGESNLLAEDAAALWPELEQRAKALGFTRIGSPAAAPCGGGVAKCNGDTTEWFDKFFAACKGCKVDFLATHTYTCSSSGLSSFLSELHQRYGLPIWLTEFNCGDGSNQTTDKHRAYMEEALPVLESLDYVERYAWMSTRNTKVTGSSLIDALGGLSPLGKYYRDFSPSPAPSPTPGGSWKKTSGMHCKSMEFLSQQGTLQQCKDMALEGVEATCATPAVIAFESGTNHNCYCAGSTSCAKEASSWLDLYEFKPAEALV